MPIDALPPTITQKLFVSLYTPADGAPFPSINNWLTSGNGFTHLFQVEVVIEVPPEFQSRDHLTRLAVASVDETIRLARVEFETTIQNLERTRQQFLALEA